MAKTYADRDKTQAQQQSEGFRVMSEVHKTKMQLAAQQRSQPKKKGD
jgi:hypothetical protein